VERTVGVVTQVRTDDENASTGGVDTILSNAGVNVILGGVGGDLIDAPFGSNIVLGDNGVVNVDGDIFTTQEGLGGDDTITGGADNFILGGFGEDDIELGGGTNTVLGDNGVVQRSGGVVTQINTTDFEFLTGRADRIVTLGGVNVILGGLGDDLIDARFGSNIVLGDNGQVNVGGDVFTTQEGLGGDDTITGGADNTILGGFGADEITLGGGTNIVLGDNGVVHRSAGAVTQVKTTDEDASTGGDDLITSEGGDNILIGGVGDDTIVAAAGANIVLGDNGEVNVGGDVFTTEEDLGGNDVIIGGSVPAGALLALQSVGAPVSNVILGGAGADEITLASGTNTVLGDNGIVRRDALGTVLEVETSGTAGDGDTIISLGGENIILGGVGADVISAPFGTNIILGDNGRATATEDVQTLEPALGGPDTITGGAGNNIILGGAGGDLITGGAGNDIVLGDNGIVRRSGGTVTSVETTDGTIGGDDVIDGGGGDNILLGGAGRDTMRGGSGDDIVVGDNGIVELTPAGAVVTSFDDDADGADELHGGEGDDVLYGGGGDDELYGELGNDALHGQGGNDILLGDTGQVDGRHVLLTDVATLAGEWALSGPASPDADPAVFGALLETDLVLLAGRVMADGTQATRLLLLSLADDGDDVLYGGTGDDALFGQRGDDELSGDDGDDLLSGGAGDDALRGGEGNDTLVGDDVHLDSADAALPNVAHGLLL
jgi:Ca2+-binding RTX toxin-like protein